MAESDVNVKGLGVAVSAARTQARESVAWSRVRWYALIYVILALLVVLGAEYAIGANHVVATTKAYTMFSNVLPGGIRGHGVIMLIIGAVLMAAITGGPDAMTQRRWRVLRSALWATSGYFLWTAVLFALAPQLPGGTFSWIAVTIWFILSFLPIILTFGPPPALITTDEVKLVALLRKHGISAPKTKDIADSFFRGGTSEAD